MRQHWRGTMVAAVLVLGTHTNAVGDPPDGPLTKCPVDAVVSGTVCMDKYEASVWRVPNPLGANKALVTKIQRGTATEANLITGGATQLGVDGGDYAPCASTGQNCTNDIYAVSLPGVLPSAHITWFQAQQACKNARKRLPSNAEWQAAVAGTPEPGSVPQLTDCNTANLSANPLSPTGSRSRCVSADGAFDMVGNLWEWVADWVPRSEGTPCGSWSGSDDLQCLVGAATTGEPGALVRGGDFSFSFSFRFSAGPLAVDGFNPPSTAIRLIGFRCAR